jgi:iron complex outermembrane recepter protein
VFQHPLIRSRLSARGGRALAAHKQVAVVVVLLLWSTAAAHAQIADSRPVPRPNESPSAPPAGGVASEAPSPPPAENAEIIEVHGVAPVPEGDTGSKLGVPLVALPATLNTVSAAELREHAIDDLDSALEWVAGVNPVFAYGGFQSMRVRGFSDFLVLNDGIRDDRHTLVSSAPQSNLVDVARLEVLKGPASVLYGYGAVGGVVNLVRKEPRAEPAYEFGLTLGLPETRRSTLGITGPLWRDDLDDLTYRLDIGQSLHRDFRGTGTERNAGTFTLRWLPSARQRLTLRASVNRDRYDTDAGIPTVNGAIPAGVARNTRYNTPQDRMIYSNFDASLDYRLRVADAVELRDRLFAARNEYDYFSTESLQVGDAGDVVERGFLFFDRHWRPVINQLELTATTKAGVPARWLAGYEFASMRGQSDRSAAVAAATVADLPLVAPAFDPQPEIEIPVDGQDVLRQQVHALYAHHYASLPASLELVLGGRFDMWRRIQRRDALDPETGDVAERGQDSEGSSNSLTYRAGLVYRPVPQLASYASYATSFRPSPPLPDDGRQLDPEVGRQIELGQRLRWRDAWQLDVALYDLAKRDVVIARGMGLFDQAGQQSSRGAELDVTGTWRQWLSVTAGYAYTHARFDRYERDGMDLAGFRPRFVPEHMANAWVRLHASENLIAGLGGRYVGRSYADDRNRIPLPAYGVMDASLSYTRGRARTVVTAANLLNNRNYFVGGIYEQIYPGPPLSALIQLVLDY